MFGMYLFPLLFHFHRPKKTQNFEIFLNESFVFIRDRDNIKIDFNQMNDNLNETSIQNALL